MDVATGQPEDHPTPLPYDPGQSPATAPLTAIVAGQLSGPTVPARDTVGEYAAPLAASEREIATAQASGMDARTSMLGHYQTAILPQGSSYGDAMVLPPVPPNAVPTEASDAYPYSGMEPTPAGVGFVHPSPLPE